MKNLFKFAGAALVAATMMFGTTQCTPDKCKDVNCNKGTCLEGVCGCDAGYEGAKCDTASSLKFIGVFDQTDATSCGGAAYTVTITPSSSAATKVLISNFGETGTSNVLTATADGKKITIDAGQTVTIAGTTGTWTASGSATLTGNTLASSYKFVNGAATLDCSASGNRR